MRIWGWFQPALPGTPGGFTLKVPGEIGDAAQPSPPPPDLSGELTALRAAQALANTQLKRATAAVEEVAGRSAIRRSPTSTRQQREYRRTLDQVREAEQTKAMLETDVSALRAEQGEAKERERRLATGG